MNFFEVFFQAVIQGLTEFLPISSSGHLSLFQHFTGNNGEGALMFSAILHLGTLVAVYLAFRKTINDLVVEFFRMIKDIFHGKFSFKNMNADRNMIVMVILSTLMLVPFFIFKDFFTSFSEDASIFAEGLCFLYTAAILIMSDRCAKGNKKPKDITKKDAVFVGFFQGVALLPGVSRSGSTISSGLFSGFSRETAVKYSFILGIPAILGGCVFELGDAVKAGVKFDFTYIIGFVVSAVVGVCAIKMVNWLVKSDKFKYFGYYTAVLGVVVLLIAMAEAIMGHPITL